MNNHSNNEDDTDSPARVNPEVTQCPTDTETFLPPPLLGTPPNTPSPLPDHDGRVVDGVWHTDSFAT